MAIVELLQEMGPQLAFPYSSGVGAPELCQEL
jgi:hypothetical protein